MFFRTPTTLTKGWKGSRATAVHTHSHIRTISYVFIHSLDSFVQLWKRGALVVALFRRTNERGDFFLLSKPPKPSSSSLCESFSQSLSQSIRYHRPCLVVVASCRQCAAAWVVSRCNNYVQRQRILRSIAVVFFGVFFIRQLYESQRHRNVRMVVRSKGSYFAVKYST